jgi:hypothetical protein
MTQSLESLLPILLPGAISWVKEQSNLILKSGSPLTDTEIGLARAVGVSSPERIRIRTVSGIPLPDDPTLRAIALQERLLGPGTAGITFGYGIYICDGHMSNRLISHECRHVFQYETAGSIDAFLPIYFHQIATVGYDNAPYEIDAREHETDVA